MTFVPIDYSTDALVMGSHKLGDADRVVSLFTESQGRVPTVVKGVRKVKSRFGGRLEPMTLLAVRLHEGRNLHTLTAADTISSGAPIRDDPASLRAGLSVIDLLSRVTTEFERRPRTWNLMQRFITLLSGVAMKDNSRGTSTALALSAQLKLLLLSGFLPHLDGCAACGAVDAPLSRFSAAAGGCLCDDCPGESFSIGQGSLESMRFLLEQPLASALDVRIDDREVNEVWRAVREVCRHHLGVDLRVSPLSPAQPPAARNSS